MMVKTGKEREEIVQEKVKSGAVQKTETYHYLGITINKEGNLEEHIKITAKKCETISTKIDAIGAKNQVGKEEIRVKLKVFDTCLMTALTWNGSMRKYKISGNEGKRENTRKGTKKDISTSSFNNLHWYRNRDRNMASRAKNLICYNNAIS